MCRSVFGGQSTEMFGLVKLPLLGDIDGIVLNVQAPCDGAGLDLSFLMSVALDYAL